MAVIVLTSPGGSPGVTTTALALTLAWPRDAVMAECDLAGGTVLAGMCRGQATGRGGLIRFALAAQRSAHAAAASITSDALPLQAPPAGKFVLTAPPGPLPARQLTTAWPAVAASFAAARRDVIADAGRLDADPALTALVAGAARVLMICRPLIRQAAAAKPRLEALARNRTARPAAELILVGDGPYGADGPKAFTQALCVPLRACLPWDPAAAVVLSDGARQGRGFGRSPLIRAAAALAAALAADTSAPPAPEAAGESLR